METIGYENVLKFIIYGPCGYENPKSLCMIKGQYLKYFSKKIVIEYQMMKMDLPFIGGQMIVDMLLKMELSLIIDLLFL